MGDALYMQSPFVKEVERLGLDWAFTLKENQPELLREAERFTQESPAGVHTEPGREIRYWHLPEVDWPVADRLVRVVKTVRIEHLRRVTVREKDGRRIKSKTAVTQESTNFYATNFELGSVSPLFIHQFSRSRWRIDTEVFQTITTDCHLKHPAVHQTTALVVLTMIRFLAYTLSPSSTTAKSAAMLAENARPFTSAPKESPIGSSPLPPTPVDFLPCGSRCVLQCSRRIGTIAGAAAFPPTAEIGTIRALCQSFSSPAAVTTLAGSPQSRNLFQISGLPPAAWHLTESLAAILPLGSLNRIGYDVRG